MDPSSLLHLDDDCLAHILDFLDIIELRRMERTCLRLERLVKLVYEKKYLHLNFSNIYVNDLKHIYFWHFWEILRAVRHQVVSLRVPASRFIPKNHYFVRIIPKYCRNLRHLSINNFTIKDDMLKHFEEICLNLETLELVDCNISENIAILVAKAKNLKNLNLKGNNRLTGRFLKRISSSTLTSLDLENGKNIRSHHFTNSLEENPRLSSIRHLNIAGCERLLGGIINEITKRLGQIESITISNFYPLISWVEVSRVAELPNLKSLKLIGGSPERNYDVLVSYLITQNLLIGLVQKNKIERLELDNILLRTASYKLVSSLVSLKFLKLIPSDGSDNILFKDLLQDDSVIEEIHIGCVDVSSEELLSLIRRCPTLKLLDLSRCGKFSDDILKTLTSQSTTRKLKFKVKENEL